MMRVEKGQRLMGVYGTAWQVTAPGHRTAKTHVASWFMHMPNQAPNNAWDSGQGLFQVGVDTERGAGAAGILMCSC